jgi:hypothetical protein
MEEDALEGFTRDEENSLPFVFRMTHMRWKMMLTTGC